MAVLLYKKGDSATINEVQCDIQRFEVDRVDGALADGWCLSVEELIEKPKIDEVSHETDPKPDTKKKKASPKKVTK